MKRFIAIFLLGLIIFSYNSIANVYAGTVPNAAVEIACQLDDILMVRFAGDNPRLTQNQREILARAKIMIIGTTPVNLTDLETTSPLSRQLQEEISKVLVYKGYRYRELRRGNALRFDRNSGEIILTREVDKLITKDAVGHAVLVGTYVVSGEVVRFTVSLIHPNSNEVMAKATASVPITDDLMPLLEDTPKGMEGAGRVPSVYTRLQ